MKILSGLSEVVDNFDVFFIDIYGVIHDGDNIYNGVINCLEKISQANKEVLFLTNLPYRINQIIEELDTFAVSRNLYQQIMSPGEELYDSLKNPKGSFFSRLGNKFYFIGPSNINLIEGLHYERVLSVESADFIIVTGPDDWNHKASDYEDVLKKAVDLHLPLICANPNSEGFERGNNYIEAGAISCLYHKLGGKVKTFGKPDKNYIFKALSFYNEIPPEKILIIGDSLDVDIMSGVTSGIQTAFISSGIHSKELKFEENSFPEKDSLQKLIQKYHINPTFTLPGLVW